MKRAAFLGMVIAGALCALAGPAAAHAMLAHAEPAVGASVAGPVTVLRLRFTERLEPALCRITLTDSAHHAIALSQLSAESGGRTLVAHVPALHNGAYRVAWRAVSVDTHITEGDFTFTVTP